MIFVEPKEEPSTFEKMVRERGRAFLRISPHPRSWKNKEYWQDCIPDLYDAYGGICAYCAEWIPETVGDPTVDHFIPKSVRPDFAYEWRNFRLACLRFNRLKRDYQDVLDPFTIGPDWFWIQFPSLQLHPNPSLSPHQRKQVVDTITRLRLNGTMCIRSRRRWIMDFRDNKISFDYLKRTAPLIARELERQKIVDKLKTIIKT